MRGYQTRSAVAVAAQPPVAEGRRRPPTPEGSEPPSDASAARDARSLPDFGPDPARCRRLRWCPMRPDSLRPRRCGRSRWIGRVINVRRGEGDTSRRWRRRSPCSQFRLPRSAAIGRRGGPCFFGGVSREPSVVEMLFLASAAEHRERTYWRHRRRVAPNAGAVLSLCTPPERILVAVDELVVGRPLLCRAGSSRSLLQRSAISSLSTSADHQPSPNGSKSPLVVLVADRVDRRVRVVSFGKPWCPTSENVQPEIVRHAARR